MIIKTTKPQNRAYVNTQSLGSHKGLSYVRKLNQLLDSGYLNEWEERFLRDIGKKMDHNLSQNQLSKRDSIFNKYGYDY